jgi:hypothetical protein
MKVSGFAYSKIVIIQSLEPHEVQTGFHLSEYIRAQVTEGGHYIPLEYIKCSSSVEFASILERLTTEVKLNEQIPIVHVECHGGANDGLEFENGSTLSWNQLASGLLHLNTACKFNLLAIFSACFGGYFLGQMGALAPAPCWCMVAPTDTADPGELMNGLRVFYSTLLDTNDAGKAAARISSVRLSKGRWLAKPAELWFEILAEKYILNHCTHEATRERVKKLRRQLIEEGRPYRSIGNITREIRRLNRESLSGKYFDEYFQTAVIPENIQRFKHARDRLEIKLNKLRSSNKYCL